MVFKISGSTGLFLKYSAVSLANRVSASPHSGFSALSNKKKSCTPLYSWTTISGVCIILKAVSFLFGSFNFSIFGVNFASKFFINLFN